MYNPFSEDIFIGYDFQLEFLIITLTLKMLRFQEKPSIL